ncbi:ATPase, P-type (transporting), HAD superfamily, subfamily IC [Gloeothece citriformis PCC 7424]|uniref:ATPase, P-type (Transporting), HAD superfamily, subfamily IC n=1 Tax=Gloeothece citriformis (strain PCC 7424) TaxID=65393 RepID=B7KID5_GLOC7|nr:cation-translocating P-type ATPase [Gloeothece citriformis]ACK73622.1 ATPase, P-type (transporting), HAD superfamily, subfamily IC [Gloeothece citriformis PCC 7424]
MTSSYTSHSLPSQQQAWHTYSVEDTLTVLGSDAEKGLTASEVEQRLKHYGSNEIEETGGRNSWEILLDQFKNIMLIMLIVVAIISGILDLVELQNEGVNQSGFPFKDTIAILLIVILNGVLGYLQESRAEKALAALKNLSSPKIQVIRAGKRLEVDAPTLVPGDIILLEAGSQLCADGQIIEAANFQVRESALTGEALAVHKHPTHRGLTEDTPLGDRVNRVFTGTEVIQGRAKVIVTNTGMTTELGKIAQMIQSVETEPTPLQQRMNQLGNVLVSGSLILVAIVVIGGVIRAGWGALQQLVEISLSMAVAVVPEGLPAVITVTLAIGTQRMVRRNALIRKLPAVETLGSVNVICSDKTGTLTQNKMVVQEVETLEGNFLVTGEGYTPNGEFIDPHEQSIQTQNYPSLQLLLFSCVLCNDATLAQSEVSKHPQGEWIILGDPTEGALLTLAGKANLEQPYLTQLLPRHREIPFSSERKRMSVISQWSNIGEASSELATVINPEQNPYIMFTKGSPELILERCQTYQIGQRTEPLEEQQRQKILKTNNTMAQRGLRVLGFACKPLNKLPETGEDNEAAEQELIWLGLVAMLDAPRPEVKIAVAKSRQAGIRPVMITGDHPLTAMAIAHQLGIAESGDNILTGRELERISQPELEQEVEQVSIYARVSPEHKLRIVQALQKRDKFVAMTGDGVNDAPALKQADIGIAMGITGTDVSKEASDMVLLDDNFATIVAATEEGRVVYNNIRHFIKYILGSNVGEVITIAAAPLIGLSGVPLTPLQILWMNLVTDGLPALALAVEPADPNVMQRPPFSPKESIFARGLGLYIVRIGIIFSIISISLMVWAFNESHQAGQNPDSWKTMVFTTLCIAQMGHAIAVRSNNRLTIEMNPFTNLYLLAAVTITTILQLMLIYVEPLRNFFNTDILTPQQLLICLLFSSLMFIWVELEKIAVRIYHKFQGHR